MKTIAIVGGGAASIVACGKLLDELGSYDAEEGIEILIFEKSKHVGLGLPYSPAEDCYILNLPVSSMSADFKDKHSFSNWLSSNAMVNASQFPPRKYFGLYLVHLLNEFEAKAKEKHISLKYFTNTEVTHIHTKMPTHYLISSPRLSINADYVILCTGHLPNTRYHELSCYSNYRHNQWAPDAFDGINPKSTVGVIGTRLSAIDTVMKLKSNQHEGKIILFSRSGLLPTVLAKEIPPYALKYLTLANFERLTKGGLKPLSLDSLLDLFWKEISDAEERNISLASVKKSYESLSALDWMKQEITQAEAGVRPWQQVLFASYPIIPNIWQRLSLDDKKQFMAEYYSLYLTYLAAFPLENAHKLKDLLESGQLVVIGGLQKIEHNDNKFTLETLKGQYECDYLFNAIGPGFDSMASPLYRHLNDNHLIKKHPIAGIDINPQTFQVLDPSGRPHRGLYAVGEITRGVCLATTDMTQLMRQIDHVGTHIAQSIKEVKQAVVNTSEDIDLEANLNKTEQETTYNMFSLFAQHKGTIATTAIVVGGVVGYMAAASYTSSMLSPTN